MVKDLLDDVWRNADVGHAGCNRAPNIVNDPVAHAGALVEGALVEAPGCDLENQVICGRLGH